jgi:acylphosphatase
LGAPADLTKQLEDAMLWVAFFSLPALLVTAGSSAVAEAPKAKACMVYYTGMVQGVGFRATAVEIAKDYAVTGWVKNLSDGRVQLLAEGPAEDVDKFLEAVRGRWKDNIEKEDLETQTPSGKYKSFDIVK